MAVAERNLPRPTVYLTEDEQNWIDDQDESRSGTIREAVERYRADDEMVTLACEAGCTPEFKARPDADPTACPYCQASISEVDDDV